MVALRSPGLEPTIPASYDKREILEGTVGRKAADMAAPENFQTKEVPLHHTLN